MQGEGGVPNFVRSPSNETPSSRKTNQSEGQRGKTALFVATTFSCNGQGQRNAHHSDQMMKATLIIAQNAKIIPMFLVEQVTMSEYLQT